LSDIFSDNVVTESGFPPLMGGGDRFFFDFLDFEDLPAFFISSEFSAATGTSGTWGGAGTVPTGVPQDSQKFVSGARGW
jgi:hypothetical protein